MVRFGGSKFSNCSVPLAFEGRYFILEGDPPDISVVCEYEGEAIFEIKRNSIVENPLSEVSVTTPGIITVSDRKTGKFLYKVRPDNETSVVFGRLDGEEISVRITDRYIKIGSNTIENCEFNGVGAGVVINSDGSFSMGCSIPPILLK